MVVLDTTFLIALQGDDPEALAVLDELKADAEPLRVPAACWIEYLSAFPSSKQSLAARHLDASVMFEAFDRRRADVAVRLQSEQRRAGRTMAWHDVQIAATAMHCGEPLVTNDRAFQDVPGLETYPH